MEEEVLIPPTEFISKIKEKYPQYKDVDDDELMTKILDKYPILYRTYRFHIDSWYMNKYYPHCGDTDSFNKEILLV